MTWYGGNFWTEERKTLGKSMLLSGATHEAIANALGCTRAAVSGKAVRDKWATPTGPVVVTPPTPAMRRLAEFDPVIRRALEVREAA